MNAEELLKNFQGMLNAYQEEHAAVAVADNTSTDMKKIISKARNAKFIKHILCTADQSVRDLYCTGLFSLFQMEKDAGNRNNAMVFVGRIIASYSDNVDLDGYLVKSAKIDTKFWSDFFEFIKGDVAFNFAVDALLMYYLSGRADAMLKGILDVVEVFSVDKKRLFGLVKAILEQDVDGVVKFDDRNFFGYGIPRRLACAKEMMRKNKKVIFGSWKKVICEDYSDYSNRNRYSNKKRELEWYILDIQKDSALLLSKFGIEGRPFFEYRGSWRDERYCIWENSYIRKWLNTEFLNDFVEERKKEDIVLSKILTKTHVDNGKFQTNDVIFLLSSDEVEFYLAKMDMRICKVDIFGNDMIWSSYGGRSMEGWRLRDKICDRINECCGFIVNNEGLIKNERLCDTKLVRPAMWVKVDSEIFDV